MISPVNELNLNVAKDESGLISEEKSVRGTSVQKDNKVFFFTHYLKETSELENISA
jgi:hypothetical protein